MSMRCAIYARYSTDMQLERSIQDQIRRCREYASQFRDFEIAEAYIRFDEAVSGTSLHDRKGLQSLVEAVKCKNPPFDVILIDETSRLARNTEDALHLASIFEFHNVAVVSATQGLDTRNKSARLLLTLHAMIDEQYAGEISNRVHRGQEGRVLEGLIAGGRCFGYNNIPIEHSSKKGKYGRPVVTGVRAEVNEDEAIVIRRIFELCADGLSLAEITESLNQEKLLAPFKTTGRKPGWVKSCVREILYNERYRGMQVWNRTRKQRNPETGRKVSRPRPECQWKRVDVPEWRIVPEELWKSAHDSLDARKLDFGTSNCTGIRRSSAGKYLFSGFLRCGVCGCNLVIVSGGGTDKKRYGCANYRFHHTCSNNFTIRVGDVENQLIQQFRLKMQDSALLDLFGNGRSAALTKGVLARQLESFVLTPLSRDGIRQFQVTGNWKFTSQPVPNANDHVTVTFVIAC